MPEAAGPYRNHGLVTTSEIKTTETNANPTIQLPPTTEKRRPPGPKGRNGVAFNDG
ncbi:replication protein [Salmonella enterica subsp. salamae]|nr:replication protein [Salmonella enterica subsp. salamae]